MRVTRLLNLLLQVQGLFAKGISIGEKGITIDVQPRNRVPRCSGCGRKVHGGFHSVKLRRWRHLGACGMRVYFRYAIRKVRCPRCKKVRVETVPWARAGSRFSHAFENVVAWLLQKTDQTAVCTYFGISWYAAGRIARSVVDALLPVSRFEHLYFIGIDEFAFRRNHQYLTIVVDHLSGRLVWAGEGKSGETLSRFFDELGSERSHQLEAVSLDLSAAYIGVVEARAPQADIVADRYHIEKLIRNAVDEVRRDEMRKLPPPARKTIKRSRWPLLKNPWNLRRGERAKLDDIARTNRRLYRAYLLKEQILAIFEYRRVGWARTLFTQWYRWARRSKLQPFVALAQTLQTHFDRIVGFIRQGLTNGRAEGINNKLRLLSHRAFGFHSAQALIGMAYLCCAGITLPLCTQT